MRPKPAGAQERNMTEREHEIADLSKELLGRIVQGAVTNGAPVDAQQCAALAVKCATALIDALDARSG
ncbi:hypothetical protein DID97_23280 [Burkholderia sp. Bp8977]|nr:hypothetical protein DIE09_21950 [Burkholderia sp. Bp9010]RQS09633.1 hypothetical protein DIE02_10755 [Burkholderia sp. Bp8991]RQS70728.1 hypothetical protein DID97_23280 [Burkholderia sp. Bp8977]